MSVQLPILPEAPSASQVELVYSGEITDAHRPIPAPSASDVELVHSSETADELWVIPGPELGFIDLPRLRHLLPAEYQSAPVVDWLPVPGSRSGAWIVSKAA